MYIYICVATRAQDHNLAPRLPQSRIISILGFRLGSDLIILMPEFHPRFPPRPKGPSWTKPLPFDKKTLDFDFHPRSPPRFHPNHPNLNYNRFCKKKCIEINAS